MGKGRWMDVNYSGEEDDGRRGRGKHTSGRGCYVRVLFFFAFFLPDFSPHSRHLPLERRVAHVFLLLVDVLYFSWVRGIGR